MAVPQPNYSSANGYISESFFTMIFDIELDAGNPPSISSIKVQVNGTDVTVTGVEVNSTDRSVKVTISSTLLAGDIIDFVYTDPTAGNDANAIQNTVGVDAASFSHSIVVAITRPGPSAPSTPTLDAGSDSGTLSDGITNDSTPTVSGTSEANATVKLYDTDGSTLLGTTTANGSGNWSITSSLLSDGSHTLKATQTNGSSQTSALSSGLTLSIDTVANAPTTLAVAAGSDSGTLGDGISNVGTPVITGKGEAGASVKLYDTDGSTVIGTATANGSGKWSITSSTLTEGSHTLTAKQTDVAGNVSSSSSGFTYTLDTVGPVGMGLSTNSVSQTSATNGSTIATLSSTDLTSVTYDFAVGNGVIDADNGKFTISGTSLVAAQSLSAGAYHIYLSATDAAGNDAFQIFTINVTSGPSVSSIVRANSASSNVPASATSMDYTVTFSESVTGVDSSDFTLTPSSTAAGSISNVSGSGATYTVTVNTLSGDGTMRLDLNASGTGIQNGSSDAITSGYTSGQTYTLDHTAPNAPSAPDMTAGTDTGFSDTDNITTNTTPTFTGTSEANATVTLYDTDGTSVLGSTTANGSGNWSITSSALGAGGHTVSAKATDAAGNVSSASSTLAATIETTAITSATYNASSGTLVVTGTGMSPLAGSPNDIDATKLTLTGEGGVTYTLTANTSNVELSSSTSFIMTLGSADRAAVNLLMNKDGTLAHDGTTTFNLGGASGWNPGSAQGATDLSANTVTVSAVTAPTITSATYGASSGELLVSGSNLVRSGTAVDGNDIVANKLTLTGEGGATYTLTDTANVDVFSSTNFTLTLSATDRAAVNQIMNKNGTTSTSGTTYDLGAAASWAAGDSSNGADPTGNAVTVNSVAAPTVTSATYDAITGVLVVTGTGFLSKTGATNDIDITKLVISGDSTAYTLTSSDVDITSDTSFTVTLNSTDKDALKTRINKDGTSSNGSVSYNLSATEDWNRGADSTVVIADTTGNGITASNASIGIASANYNAATGELSVTAVNITAGDTIDPTKLTLKGEDNATYTLTSSSVTAASSSAFSITLNATDQAAVGLFLNKDGTSSTSGTLYNLAGAANWDSTASAPADLSGNGVTVANTPAPTITSATYGASSGVLVVTATGLRQKSGATNDIDATKLTLTGEGGATYTLTADTSNVELSNGTSFTMTLGSVDRAAVNLLMNKNGTQASDGTTTFNLGGASGWNPGSALGATDLKANTVTVSTVAIPTITSATYNATTGVLVVTGTGFLSKSGSSNDINVSKLSILAEGSTVALSTSSHVDVTNGTTFTVTLSATDKAALGVLVNQVGTKSSNNVDYNLAAAEDWAAGADTAVVVADLSGNGITVSNIPSPTITSATWTQNTGVLAITGSNFVTKAGAANDVNVLKLTLTGDSTPYTLTANTTNVEIASATSINITLGATDKAALASRINKEGTSSTGSVTYNLAAAEDWLTGSAGSTTNLVDADLTGNGITAGGFNVAPVITSNGGGATASVSVTENATAVTTVTASDVDNDTVTFSITGGSDSGKFSISASTGALTFAPAPNFEAPGDSDTNNSYVVAVTASDGKGGTAVQTITVTVTNKDEVAPTITSGATATAINENSGANQVVYTATSTDTADIATGSTVYSLKSGSDTGLSINASTGAVTLATNPDFETKPSYSFTVVATDAANNASEKAVTLAINNKDEVAPTITSSATATAIDENSGANQVVYTATSTDTGDIATGSTTYSLKTGSDTGLSINASTGAVTLATNPDFETKSSFSFTVVATDAANNASEKAVTLAINNKDEVAPTITSGATATAINENSGAAQVVYTATSTDTGDIATGATTYSLKTGSDTGLSINASTGAVTLATNPDFETKSSYSFTVVATDAANNASEKAVTLAINNKDEVAPTITSGATATAINENSGANQVVYTATSTDTGDIATGATTYSLKTGSDTGLTINASTGAVTLTANPDFETKPSYSFTVVATDAANNASEKAVTLAINNKDEVAPTITSAATATAINENSGANQVVYTSTSTDTGDIAAGNTSYSLKTGSDAGLTINASTGAVTLTANPDFETKPSYSFTVVATDEANNASEKAVTLAINNKDEVAPTITSGATATAINENSGAGQTVYTATSTDTGDIATGATTYNLKSGSDAGLSINAATGAVMLSTNPDFEAKSSYSFTVVATDAASNASEKAVTLAINNKDEVAPTITSGATATAINENSGAGQTVYTATSTDTGDIATGTTSYSLKSGSDTGLSINASTGAVTLTANPDFETKSSYNFTVVATDAANNASEKAVTLEINNKDEVAPIFTSGASIAAISENSGSGQTIYTATSVDTGDIATGVTTYSLKAGSDAGLIVNANTGVVTLTGNPDFEGKPGYSFTIVATDTAQNASEKALTLAITNVNEAPTVTSAASASVAENAPASTVVYTATATDPDAGTTLSYALTGSDADLLSINAATGAVNLKTPANFEARSSYSFNVTATDNGNLSASKAVTLGVTNVNEAPSITSGSSAVVANNSPVGTLIYRATASDPDAGDTLTYSLSGADAGLLNINSASGTVTLKTSANLNAKASYSFNVVASDKGGLTDSKAISAQVTADSKNEAPVITSGNGAASITLSSPENQTSVTTITASDPNASDTLTYSLAGGADQSAFTINAQTGALRFVNAPDFEQPTDAGKNNGYEVIVQASDGQSSARQTITVQVSDAPEDTSTAAPSVQLSPETDTGMADNDGVTNKAAIALTGQAEAFATVTVSDTKGNAIGSTKADQNGTWTLPGVNLATLSNNAGATGADGLYTLSVKAVDLALNQSTASTLTVELDTTAPPAPLTPQLDAASDSAPVGDGKTSNLAPSFTVPLPSGATSTDRLSFKADLDGDGSFETTFSTATLTAAQLAAGAATLTIDARSFPDNRAIAFQATLIDKAGNTSTAASTTVAFTTDFDGLTPATENAGSAGGDFNADGLPDSQQNDVATAPLTNAQDFTNASSGNAGTANYGSLIAGDSNSDGKPDNQGSIQLSDVGVNPVATAAGGLMLQNLSDQGLGASSDVINFTATADANHDQTPDTNGFADADPNRAGVQVRITMELGGGVAATKVIKVRPDGTSFDFTATSGNVDGGQLIDTNGDGKVDRIILTITDNAAGDFDARTGVIADPLLLAKPNSAPVFTSHKLSIPENTTAVNTLTATDADNDVVSFGISGGSDASKFAISSSGVLSFTSAPDFEKPADSDKDNVYQVNVQASDGLGGTSTQSVEVRITNVADTGIIAYSGTSFAESSANDGAIAGQILISISADTFAGAVGAALGQVSNVPAGLTAVLVKSSDTTATLSFTGKATAHESANHINNLTVSFGNADFGSGDASFVAGAVTNNLHINFTDSVPPVTKTVDGVTVGVQTSTDTATSLEQQALNIAAISASRVEDTTTANAKLADIGLDLSVNTAANQAQLAAALPTGVAMTASGPIALLSGTQASTDLLARIEKTATGTTASDMLAAAHGFLSGLGSNSVLDKTITLSASSAPADTPLLTGNTSKLEAVVLDASGLPANSTIQLDNVDFSAVLGALHVTGGAGHNHIVGDANAQWFAMGAGNDAVSGGAGNDVLTGARSDVGQWQFYLDANGAIKANLQSTEIAASGLDSKASDANFLDLRFLSSSTSTVKQAVFLYQAAFGRPADLGGLNFYLANQSTPTQLAKALLNAAEWSSVHGATAAAMGNDAFVSGMYQTALGRAADAAGKQFWVDALNKGMGREQVLLSFAQSAEMQTHLNTSKGYLLVTYQQDNEKGWITGSGDDRIDGGSGSDVLVGGDGVDTVVYAGSLPSYKFLLTKSGEIKVAETASGAKDTLLGFELGEFGGQRLDISFTQATQTKLNTLGLLYQTLLDRPADVGGLNYWLKSDWSAQQYAQGMLVDAEFVQRNGQLSDKAFVELLYHNTLSRDADAGGLKFWSDYLSTGHSRAEMLAQWIQTAEVVGVQYGSEGLWLV